MIDVLLVLLVIFMAALPLSQSRHWHVLPIPRWLARQTAQCDRARLCSLLGVMGASLAAVAGSTRTQRGVRVGSMRAIMSAQVDYRSVNGGFADNLATLGKPCPGTPVALLSPQLAKNGAELDGYVFAAAPSGDAVQGAPDCNGIPTSTVTTPPHVLLLPVAPAIARLRATTPACCGSPPMASRLRSLSRSQPR